MSPLVSTFAGNTARADGEFQPSSIVTAGLVLYWDLNNPNSYPGYGTVIRDLSGNNNNGYISGYGYTFSNTNGGIISFSNNGTNTIMASTPNLTSSNFTVMGATKYNGTGPANANPPGPNTALTNQRIISGSGNNWLLGNWGNNTYVYYCNNGWISTTPPYATYSGTDNNWHIWTGTGIPSTGVFAFYEGTSLIASGTNIGSQGPAGFNINNYSTIGTEWGNGSMGFLLAYNRVLTSGEIAQNYNYFASRYPKPVTSGLITQLDAANINSYPLTSSGTVWNDLSASGNNYYVVSGALTNTAPYYMNFNGPYGMAASANQTNPVAPAAYTLMVWTRVLNSTADWRTLYRPYTNYHDVLFQQGAYNLGMYNNVSGGYLDSGYLQTSLPNYGTSNWVCLFFQINNSISPYWTMSYNDTPGTVRAQITLSGAYTPYMLGWLGGYGANGFGVGGSQFWGDIAYFSYYNRTLTSGEMLQNFNATRARFGL